MYSWEGVYLIVDKNLALLGPREMKLLAEMRAIEAMAAILTKTMMFKLLGEVAMLAGA